MLKSLRKNKVLIDWSQNDEHKTTVCVYSMRATQDPSVSMPLEWSEVEALLAHKNLQAVRFHPDAAVERVKREGDRFEPLLSLKQKLPELPAPPSQPPADSRTTSRGRLSGRNPRKTG